MDFKEKTRPAGVYGDRNPCSRQLGVHKAGSPSYCYQDADGGTKAEEPANVFAFCRAD